MSGKCFCGHTETGHVYDSWRYQRAGCGLCSVCGKSSDDHEFISHPFTRCGCDLFRRVRETPVPETITDVIVADTAVPSLFQARSGWVVEVEGDVLKLSPKPLGAEE